MLSDLSLIHILATAYQNLSDYDFNSVPDGSEMTFGIVVAEWNKHITEKLLEGACNTLEKHGVKPENIYVKRVPGSFEPVSYTHLADGSDSRPQIIIVMNFTRPTETKPSLLTFDEVNTLLHEFGHALHGMFAEGKYASLSGTNVYRDFVCLLYTSFHHLVLAPE